MPAIKDRFYIGMLDQNASLQTDLQPYAIPDNAFAELQNAYVFRGRVRKRFGAKLMRGTAAPISGMEQIQSRFKITSVALTTTGAGALPATLVPGIVFQIGQAFSIGGNFFTVYQNGLMYQTGSNIGSTDSSGNASGTLPGSLGVVGQSFTIGSQTFTVTLANGALTTGGPASGTLNTVTGAYTFTGATPSTSIIWFSISGSFNTGTGNVTFVGVQASAAVYFYPAQPVMGLVTYQQPEPNVEDVVGFDTQFAYQFAANGWERLGTAVWTGSNSDFFWGYNAQGLTDDVNYLYVTNYNVGTTSANSDPMRYWNGAAWVDFTPRFNSLVATDIILTARIIVYFKNRLVLLNVVENTGGGAGTNKVYANRCRYSWADSPVNVAAFYEDTTTLSTIGGYVDCPTSEAIITAEFLKDRLIVYFESSTWELVFIGNQFTPFVWQQINNELGAESTFSQVQFDKVVLGVGNVGIHACNGTNVDRIDQKIHYAVFEIHNDNNGIERVAGIRDYFVEMIYWTFPDENQDTDYPFNNRVLVYNYKTGSWAFNDDSITAFGYFQTVVSDASTSLTWADLNLTWSENNATWRSAVLQAKFRSVIAGNQEGFTFIVDPTLSFNSPSLQITNMTYVSLFTATLTVINHNLSVGDYVRVENAQGVTSLNGNIYQIISRTPTTITLSVANTITGTYSGGGTLTRVTPIDIKTKQFNFYANQGRNAYVSKVDCLVTRTANPVSTTALAGQCTVDYLVSSSNTGIYEQLSVGAVAPSSPILETSAYRNVPYEEQQERLWHPVYMWADGESIQFRFYLTKLQATDPLISEVDFELHAMVIWATPTSDRLQ